MRKILLAVVACLLFAQRGFAQDEATVTATAEEDKKPWSVDTSVGLYSSYMWRGFRLYDGLSIQPSVTGSVDTGYGTLSANGWMHLTGDSHKRSERFTEFDGTLKYENQFGPVTIGAGHIWYVYSDYGDGTENPNSEEFFGTVAVDVPLTPTLTVYEDYDLTDSQFYELAVSHEFAVFGDETAITPYASFGFASNGGGYKKEGLEEVTIGASTSLPFGPLSFDPTVNYTFAVDEYAVNQLWAGLVLSYSF